MKRQWRIPTILGILVIGISLGGTVFLSRAFRNYLGWASQEAIPSELKITNVSDTSFSVSWVTTNTASGTINYGENSSSGNIARDDRDQVSGQTGQYTTHHITLRYLKPQTKYYFKIISGGKNFSNNGQDYLVTTAPTLASAPAPANPAYGVIQKPDNTPAEGAIVYLVLTNSTPLSTLVKSSGNWLINLSSARTADLSDFVKVNGQDKVEIFVQGGNDGVAQAKVTVEKASPVPQITLGKNYDFTQKEVAQSPSQNPTPTASPSGRAGSGFSLPSQATSSPSLAAPASGSIIPSDHPVFTGTGVPGKTIQIIIESSIPITATVVVDENGNWHWTPPANLPPGTHTVTVKTADSNNNSQEFVRQFTILASGTQVVEAATISASPTASPTTSPTATSATEPASGNITPTFLLTLFGLALFVLGFGRIFLLDRQ